MGTNTWSAPDDSTGTFGVTGMAEGTYRVRILTTLDAYVPKDTVLRVTAGKVDTLTHDIVLQYTGIPVPSGLKISYDTLKQIVTLSWNKPVTGRKVAGYGIYRKRQDSTSFVNIKNGLTDTVYRDSTGVQDQTYEYRVAAIDTNGTEGVKSAGEQVRIASYLTLDTTLNNVGNGPGQFDDPTDIAIAANGDIYIVDKNNNRVQVYDSTMVYIREFGNGVLKNPNKISVDEHKQAFVVAGYDTIFVFDSIGMLIKKISTIQGIFDLDAKDSSLFVITNGDSVSVCSYDGTKKRTWGCGDFNSSDWIVAGDPSAIVVSNSPTGKVLTYDTLGNNLSVVMMPYYTFSIAVDELKHRLYTVCLDDIHGNTLRVTDKNNIEIAIYKIPNTPTQISEPTSIGLQKNGAIYLVLSSSNKILKLKTLLP